MNQPWTTDEQETIINIGKNDELVRIWTNIPAHVRAFSKKATVTTVAAGNENGQPWAEFTIPTKEYSPAQGVKNKRKPLTEEQRAALSERLQKARDKK